MKDLTWSTQLVSIEILKPLANNPRSITDSAYNKLDASVGELGNFKPLIVDTDLTILAGNQRYQVLKTNGYIELEVSVPSRKLTKRERDKIILIDNLHAGVFDMDMLANEFEEDLLRELDFDVPTIEPDVEEDDFNPDALERNIHNVTVGDIWQLGEHRLACGDATILTDVVRLADHNSIKLFHTDPPYGVEYEGQGKQVKQLGQIKNDTLEGLDKLLSKSLANAYSVVDDACVAYVWHTDQKGDVDVIFKNEFRRAGWTQGGIIIWSKPNASMGWNDYRYRYEPCIYGWKNNHQFYGDRSNTNVWEVGRDGDGSHPTMKPIALCSKAIQNSSKQGDGVLDLFGGSGSTLIACEQLQRKCYMMELDPHYCSVIIERWQKLTGNTAQRVPSA